MNKLIINHICTLLASTALLWTLPTTAATYSWDGTSSDLTINTNWTPQTTPTTGDTGTFDTASSYTPEVTQTTSSQTFLIDLVHFTGGSPYTFNINDLGSSITFVGSGPGPFYGVKNDSGNNQLFKVFNEGKLTFQNDCSADSSAGSYAGHLTYEIGDTASFGTLVFDDDASAGNATIVVNNGSVLFNNDSTGGHATLMLESANSSLEFLDEAGSNNMNVTAKNGNVITFKEFSNGEGATFTLGDAVSNTNATLNFIDKSSAGVATINLSEGSTINCLDNSTIGMADISMTAADTVNLAQTGNSFFYANLNGNGTLNKTGTGKLTYLADNSAFSGNTHLYAGNFSLNDHLGGNVFVHAGGLLSGTGSVIGNVNVGEGGVIAPGNSVGTMSISGTYTQATGSTYNTQVDGVGNASSLIVGGQTSLNMGSQLNVVPLVTQLAPNQTFTAPIISSNVGVSGTYSDVSSTNPLISVALSYDPNHVFLTWTNAFAVMSQTSNQRRITDQLQTLSSPSADEFAALSALAELPPSGQQHTLNQLTAQPYANLLITAELANHKFIRRLYNPLRLLVTSHPCAMAACCSPCSSMVDTWLDGGWNRSNFRGNHNAKGFNLKGFEISTGAQITLNNAWTVGLAGCYQRDLIHYKVGGKGTCNTYLGGLYTLYRPSDFYLLGDLVLGCSQSKIRRHVDMGSIRYTNHGKPDVFQGSLYVEAGQDFGVDCFLFQPFIGIEAGHFQHDAIREGSYDPLFAVNVNEKTYGSASSRLGVHFLTELSCFKLFFDAAWQYRLSSLHNTSQQRFKQFGSSYSISGIPFARSSFEGALNLSATLIDGLEVYTEAQGQWWKDASTFSVVGGFIIAW